MMTLFSQDILLIYLFSRLPTLYVYTTEIGIPTYFFPCVYFIPVINCSQVMQQRLNSVSKDDYEALYKELQVRVRVVDLPF